MQRLLVLVPCALAATGCPPPTQYLITDVTAARAPVRDALVAADCGTPATDAALRTDATGRARLQFRRHVDASKCAVVVAKPGFSTAVATGVSICTTPACPATHVELGAAMFDGDDGDDDGGARTYAPPPRGAAMEVAR